MAVVTSVNLSERKGTVKHPVPEIQLRCHHGILGDAHAGDWHRQGSLLAEESVDSMRAAAPMALDAGAFAENINTQGIELKALPVGTLLKVGPAVVRVTQTIKRAVGKCVMPTEGIFATVEREGAVRPGDTIEVWEGTL